MNTLFLTDKVGKEFTGKEKIMYALIALFSATLYIPGKPVINNVCIALIFVYSFFFNPVKEKLRLLKVRPAMVAILLFYLLNLVSVFFSANKEHAVTLLGLRIPLLMFPIAIGLIYIREEFKDRILLVYSFVTTAAAFICLVSAFITYRITHDVQFLYNDNLTIAIKKQSIYFALMVNIAIFGYTYLLTKNSAAARYRALIYGSIFFLLLINFMLASRAAIIMLYVALFGFAFFYIFTKRKYLEGATLILGLLMGSFMLIKIFPKTLNRFKELGYTHYEFENNSAESHYNMELTADQWNGANIRLAVWKCGWQLAREDFIFGAQLGDEKGRMLAIYKEKHFDFALKTERNMHNNYLDVLCTFGITGLIPFLAGFLFLPVISCLRAKDMIGLAIQSVFIFSMVTETYLDRSIGAVLIGFFMSFIAGYQKEFPANQ